MLGQQQPADGSSVLEEVNELLLTLGPLFLPELVAHQRSRHQRGDQQQAASRGSTPNRSSPPAPTIRPALARTARSAWVGAVVFIPTLALGVFSSGSRVFEVVYLI